MRQYLLPLLAVLIGSSVTVSADPMGPARAPWVSVALTSQTVEISLSPDRVSVTGTYLLHNKGAKEITIPVGYPRGPIENELRDFKVCLCDTPLTVTQRSKGDRPKPHDPNAYRFEGPYPDWKQWEMTFAKDEKKALSLSYWVEPTKLDTAEHGEVLYYSYILRSGATWKGPIERATLRVTLHGVAPDDLIRVVPGGSTRQGNVLTWMFEHFKPPRDIEIVFRESP